MRLWSIHPKYLDRMGLLAVWREGLLAKKVLEGKTVGYKNHPQLLRFKNTKNSLNSINTYLHHIEKEASERKYKFDKNKIEKNYKKICINVTSGQLEYEFKHLKNKLKNRDKIKYSELKKIEKIKIHPLFKIIKGNIESFEKTNKKLAQTVRANKKLI
ncbi:MAG: hypothetical protein Athens071416_305 [Parcubacteria group bacterium Athens0714_16]|nr:MAG: hypothetical protein Athens071416_305 [Parcubacteria group bacterium Athens0714_16]